MKEQNPIIPLQATFEGCKLIVEGLRELPIKRAEGLLAELVGQINEFIKTVEDKEKADAEASTKAVDAVVKTLIPKIKRTKLAAAAAAAVDGSDPVL